MHFWFRGRVIITGPRARRILWYLPAIITRPSYLLEISACSAPILPHFYRGRKLYRNLLPPAREDGPFFLVAIRRHTRSASFAVAVTLHRKRRSLRWPHRILTTVVTHHTFAVILRPVLVFSHPLFVSLSLSFPSPLRRAPFDLSLCTNHEPLRVLGYQFTWASSVSKALLLRTRRAPLEGHYRLFSDCSRPGYTCTRLTRFSFWLKAQYVDMQRILRSTGGAPIYRINCQVCLYF